MRILVDADACPVKQEIIEEAEKRDIPVVLVASVCHQMPEYPGVEIVIVEDLPDEADWKIVCMAEAGDLVVTQDYELAASVLGKKSLALSPRGWPYTDYNIVQLLDQRHRAQVKRAQGRRTKGPKPFRKSDRANFRRGLADMLDEAEKRQAG